MFNKSTILITGGTGSFGNRFIHKILKDYNPKKVIIFSRDELKQYDMQNDIKDKRLRFFLGDVHVSTIPSYWVAQAIYY